MTTMKEAASAFLATKRIAVTGVSRNGQGPRIQHRVQAST